MAVLLLFAGAAESWGQNDGGRGRGTPPPAAAARNDADSADDDLADNVFLPADRQSLQRLTDARGLLSQGRFSEAVRNLGGILDAPEDFFFQPDKQTPIYRSLKAEARRLIGAMPREGRELYELRCGARAKSVLEDALAAGDPALLAEVSRRFFHTQSGYQATLLLGLHHYEHGRPLAAALTLERLREAGEAVEGLEPTLSLSLAASWLQAGRKDKAQEVLVSLRRREPTLRVTVAGRETPIFTSDVDAVDWLVGLIGNEAAAGAVQTDHWLLTRGDPARNATTAATAPLLNARWRVPSTDDPAVETVLMQRLQEAADLHAPLIPSLHPLAVDDLLLMRTSHNLLAVDFATGKRLWETLGDPISEVLEDDSPGDVPMRQASRQVGVEQRMSEDSTYGTMSSDGRRIFAVEDANQGLGPSSPIVQRGGGRVLRIQSPDGDQAFSANCLTAYDIPTGKLAWQVGGPSGPHALRQPDTFFLGPPLPLMGQLYALAETKGEICLLALDGASGDLLWSQQLAIVEQGIGQEPARSRSGIAPSYADGVLVCPTSTGAIVGVDLATRSLLWGYRYELGRAGRRRTAVFIDAGGLSSHWLDAGLCIADGRAFATPVESDSLYCLNLLDGDLLWKAPRQGDLYVACVEGGKVVLVGRRAVRALQVADGKPAWGGRTVTLPENSVPSGRGLFGNGRYFLPLSSAEILDIDLAEGQIARVAKSRQGIVPGNLIYHRGKVVSQGFGGVEAYSELDAVRDEAEKRLSADPNDIEALALRGEVLLDAGRQADAIAAFRRAYEIRADKHIGDLLRDSLLDGLRTDFAAYRQYGAELERLLDNPTQQADFLRLMAEGLRDAGDFAASFAWCQKLIGLERGRAPLDEIDKNWSSRRDRWFQGQLAGLRAEAKEEAAQQIDAATTASLRAAMAAGSIAELQRFLDCFGECPGAATAREALVRRLRSVGRTLDAELTAASETAPAVESQAVDWPQGALKVETNVTKRSQSNGFGRFVIDVQGDSAADYAGGSLEYDDTTRLVTAYDGLGRPRWRISLLGEEDRPNFVPNHAAMQARADGHLLLLALGMRLYAIDTLGEGRHASPRLLWSQSLAAPTALIGMSGLRMPFANAPLWQRSSRSSDRLHLLGPSTSRYICFQRSRSLVAIDPRTGQTLWTRQDVTPGSDLFGDDGHLLAVSSGREDAMLLRPTDGKLLGACKVPRICGRQTLPSGEEKVVFARMDDSSLATFGRRVLLWWPEGNRRLLTLVDPVEGRDLWPGRWFSSDARACVVDDRAVGVLEPDGHFTLVAIPDGRTIADVRLDIAQLAGEANAVEKSDANTIDMTLLSLGGKYFLMVYSSESEGNPRLHVVPMPGCPPKAIHRGLLYAFSGQGDLLWPKPTVIDDQYLLLSQPPQLPILTFACQANGGDGRQQMVLLCVDRRNGRKLFRGEFTNHAGVLNISGDAAEKSVEFEMQQNRLRLTFTDAPLPPGAADSDEPLYTNDDDDPVRTLWKSMQKMIGRMIDGVAPQPKLAEPEKE